MPTGFVTFAEILFENYLVSFVFVLGPFLFLPVPRDVRVM